MSGLDGILSVLLFGSELAFWWGAGRVAFLAMREWGATAAWIAGVVTVAVVLLLWGMFFSPKANARLPLVPRVVLIALATMLTGALLYKAGDAKAGLLIGIVATLIQVIGQIRLQ